MSYTQSLLLTSFVLHLQTHILPHPSDHPPYIHNIDQPPHTHTHTHTSGAENVAVKVQIDPQISGNRDMDCSEESPISFVASPTDEDKAPYLTVESYDNRINLIDYKTILNEIESQVSVDVCACA